MLLARWCRESQDEVHGRACRCRSRLRAGADPEWRKKKRVFSSVAKVCSRCWCRGAWVSSRSVSAGDISWAMHVEKVETGDVKTRVSDVRERVHILRRLRIMWLVRITASNLVGNRRVSDLHQMGVMIGSRTRMFVISATEAISG